MTPEEQKCIVCGITGAIRDKLCAQIDACAMPSDFDGFEIRWILERMFQAEGQHPYRYASAAEKARKRDFVRRMRRINSTRDRLG
ncbi:MAG: hypothetical protein E6Q97_33555 [Desulfurellales bacterium]|nr:MAG: hypothetical protein E6Q97_33555 [Desulfurellales bacterium]